MTRYYALTNEGDIVALGEHAEWYDADEYAELNVSEGIVWTFEEEIAQAWMKFFKDEGIS